MQNKQHKQKRRFDIRMLYAGTHEQRERAKLIGCNWAVVYTCGHRRNDFPLFYNADKRIAALRKRQSSAEVREEQSLLREGVAHAHRLGLNALIHSYEMSIPEEFRTIYPELYQPEVREYRNACKEVRKNRSPCPSDARVREIVSEKVAATIAAAGEEGVDAYAFTLNECLSGTRVSHRCELCRDIPFPRMIKWMADAVRDGVRHASPKTLFFHRTWGLNENDDGGARNIARRFKFYEGHGEAWLEAYAKTFSKPGMAYLPSRDLPAYVKLQANENMGFITKGTWGDVSIDHPLNPYIPMLAAALPTVVELSWENTNHHPKAFHVLANQFQRMARYARSSKAAGLAGIPCAWGYKMNHHGTAGHEGGGREWIGKLSEEKQRLALLNFDVFEAVTNDPNADISRVIERALTKRFGKKLPRALTGLIMESQSIRAGINNCRGIQCTGRDLGGMYYQILRYGPTVPEWEKRLSRAPVNLKRIFREKQAVLRRADAILAEISEFDGKIPRRAFNEFLSCFGDLRDEAHLVGGRQILHFLLWALKDGAIKPDMKTILMLERQIRSDSLSLQA